jgi:hypothetical protein
MAIVNIAYSANTTITMDLSALAASSTFVAGRESTQVDNTTNLYVDALVSGRFIVGTTPTLPCQLNVYVWGADTSLATTAIDVLDGTDSAETLTNTTVLTNALRLGASCPVLVNTSNTTYDIAPFSVAQLFGGILPKFWGLYVAHNMTAALKTDAGNTNSFRFNGITYTVA